MSVTDMDDPHEAHHYITGYLNSLLNSVYFVVLAKRPYIVI